MNGPYLRSGASPSGDAERVDVPRGSVLRRGRRNHELNLPRAAAEEERLQFIRLELFLHGNCSCMYVRKVKYRHMVSVSVVITRWGIPFHALAIAVFQIDH